MRQSTQIVCLLLLYMTMLLPCATSMMCVGCAVPVACDCGSVDLDNVCLYVMVVYV